MKKSENLSKKHHLGIEMNACKTGRGISHSVEANPDAGMDQQDTMRAHHKTRAKTHPEA